MIGVIGFRDVFEYSTLIVDLLITFMIINSTAAFEPMFHHDKFQSISSDESGDQDQGPNLFADWNKPMSDTKPTLVAVDGFDPAYGLCHSDRKNDFPPSGKIRARGAAPGSPCVSLDTNSDGAAHKDGPKTDESLGPELPNWAEDDGEEANGHDNNDNNGKAPYPPETPD